MNTLTWDEFVVGIATATIAPKKIFNTSVPMPVTMYDRSPSDEVASGANVLVAS